MIGTLDIKVNAAHPNMPLCPIYAHIGSPSQVRIINVPKAIGKWAVTSVQITANYPDNTSRSVSCTLVGGCWSATIPASTAVGQSIMGFKVTASGTDESGAAVTGYVLGKGDVFILNDDSTITIGETTYYVHLLDAQPATPKKGDLCLIEGAWKIYNGTEWIAFGGGTGDVRHAEFSDMQADLDPDESSMGDVMTKVNTLINKLKGTTAALVALLAIGSFAAVEVQTAKLSTLPGKTLIVTNVTGAAASSDLTTATNVLATAITNKADKIELAGYLPLDGSVSMTGRLINDNGFQTSYYNGFIASGSEHSAYYTASDISYDQHVYLFPSKSGTFALTSDIPTIPSTNALLKGNGSGGIVAATAGTDYLNQTTADGRYVGTNGTYYVSENWGLSVGDFPIIFKAGEIYWFSGWADCAESANHVAWDNISGTPDLVTYASENYNTAEKILSSAENTAGTIVDRGYTPTNAVVALSRSVQYVSPNGGTITVLKPSPISGGIRDWVIYAYPTADAALCLTNLTHARFADDSVTNTLPANVYTAIYLTEIDPATETFAIGRAKLEKGW